MSSANQPASVEMTGSDVFLSYSRDDQPLARKVLDLLTQAGISVWWDAMLEGGERFHEVTEFNLENSAAVVVLWSEISTKSHWVHDEATRGRDRGCLIPVSIDGTLPPLGFRQFQWIDISKGNWTRDDPDIQKLVRAVEAKRDGTSAVPTDATASLPAAASAKSQSNVSRRNLMIGSGVGALALAGAGAWSAGWIGGSATANRKLAVLPFEVRGDPGEQSYIVEEFSGEIRSLLARNPLLHVAAKTSSSAFSDGGVTAGEICGKLGVDFLLNGDVQIREGRLVGSAQLENGLTDRVVLPFDIDAPLDSVLTLQQQIAAQVVQELAGSDSASVSGKEIGGTTNLAAYDAFLRGRELYDAGTNEGTDRAALAQFDEAIRLDPEYAAALAMRSQTLGLIGNLYASSSARAALFAEAEEVANRAVEVAPEFANAHLTLGNTLTSRLEMKAARLPYERAYELGAGDADVLSRFALFKGRMGDAGAARNAIEGAIALDPLNVRVFRFAAYVEYDAGDYAKSIEHFDKALELQSPLSSYHYYAGLSQLAMGNVAAAKTSFEADPFFVWNKTGLAIVEHKLGNVGTAKQHLDELQAAEGDKSSYQYMQIYAQWGDLDAALDAMDTAWTTRDAGLVQIFNDPLVEPIRGSPRFMELVRRMGFV
uniref:TIR domain-containing protein n=1 Tax=uncultured Erythrobacter sp. TaxID=263913 RepID=UPI00260A3CEB|nr:TIR domain-containing protein [uncultured Erythrobacter sp.]